MGAISLDEAVAVLRDMAAHAKDLDASGGDWADLSVSCRFRGWTAVFFNDCGQLDYLDGLLAPDGRKGLFDDWPTDPLDAISREEAEALAQRFGLTAR